MKQITAIFLLCLALAAAPAFATPVSKQQAEAYYTNCKSQNDPRFSKDSQKMFCACTAAKILNGGMSVEDVQDMRGNDQPARNALNKMIVNVYAPCMDYPAQEHYMSQCMTNPQTDKLTGNKQRLCSCLAGKMASYLKQNGPQTFQTLLARNPNLTDPMQALTDDAQFKKFAQSQLMACVIN